jgi:predicted nucleic acid-binding protein
MADLPRAYWDACAWLGLLNEEPAKVRPLEHIYELALRGQFEIWTSAISYVEVFRLQSEQKQSKPLGGDGHDRIRDVIEQSFVRIIPVDMEIGRRARALRRELAGFEGAGDAVHLASALVWNIEIMHTWDRSHLLPWNGIIYCKNGKPLTIEIPTEMPDSGPLFEERQEKT